MNTLAQIIDNRINPLMLRELRQMVRNRFLIVLIHLFLAVLVIACFSFTLFEQLSHNEGNGNILFGILTGIMTITCGLAVLGLTARTTATERVNEDLMFISTLRPSTIVFGKAWAGAVLTVMLMSATAPFVMLAYLLRGLDIQTIILTFFSVFISIQVLNSIFVCAGSNMKTKAQMSGLTLGGCLLFFFIIVPMFSSFLFTGRRLYGVGTADFWFIVLGSFLISAGTSAIFLSLAIRSFSPPTSNRSLPVRLTVTAVFVGSFLFALFCILMPFSLFSFDPFCRIWLVVLCFFTLFIVCESDDWSVRIKHSIPKNKLLRIFVFPFYSGAVNGFVWWFILVACVFAVAVGLLYDSLFFSEAPPLFYWLLFSFDYCVTAMFLRLRFLSKWTNPESTGVIVLILALTLIFGGALLYIACTAGYDMNYLFDETYSESFFAMFNPFLLYLDSYHNHGFSFQVFGACVWTAVLALPFIVWLVRRVRQFSPDNISGVMTFEEAVEAVRLADANPLVQSNQERNRLTTGSE